MDNMETCLHYEWYQEGQISSFEIFNNNRDSYLYSADISGGKWEHKVPLTIEGMCYRLFVYSRSLCCETWQVDSKEMEIMQCSRPETVSNLRLSTVHYGQDFLELSWTSIGLIQDNITVYVHPTHMPVFSGIQEFPSNPDTNNIRIQPLEYGRQFDIWAVRFNFGKASEKSEVLTESLYPQQPHSSELFFNTTTRKLHIFWTGYGFYGKAHVTVNTTGDPTFDCLMNVSDPEKFECEIDASAHSLKYSAFYGISTVFESNAKKTSPAGANLITPPKYPF
ncbi:uncharacterized protein LOC142354952, partial [Convolutriloba macropyga]|uniref:uncharacterized protein LOC142354952 n=1 Tax=Convolutriloba macropyga TaxID=536237 RepID=UPI003F51C3BD